MSRRPWSVLAASCAVASLLAACGGAAAPTSPAAPAAKSAPAKHAQAAASVPAPAPAAGPKALKHVTLMLDVNASGYDAPFVLAQDKGYYKAAGLDVTIKQGKGSSTTVELVSNGSVTFGWGDFGAMMTLASKGAPVKAVAVVGQESPLAIMTVGADTIKTVKDVEGHSVGANPGGSTTPLFKALMVANHVDQSKVRLVAVNVSAEDQLLMLHKMDALIGWTTYDYPALVADGAKQVNMLLFADHGVNALNLSLMASDSTVGQHPNLVKAFVGASLKGWDYTVHHQREAIDDLLKAYPSVKRTVAKLQLEKQLQLLHTANTRNKPIGWISPKDVQATQTVLHKYMGLHTTTNLNKYYSDAFVPTT